MDIKAILLQEGNNVCARKPQTGGQSRLPKLWSSYSNDLPVEDGEIVQNKNMIIRNNNKITISCNNDYISAFTPIKQMHKSNKISHTTGSDSDASSYPEKPENEDTKDEQSMAHTNTTNTTKVTKIAISNKIIENNYSDWKQEGRKMWALF